MDWKYFVLCESLFFVENERAIILNTSLESYKLLDDGTLIPLARLFVSSLLSAPFFVHLHIVSMLKVFLLALSLPCLFICWTIYIQMQWRHLQHLAGRDNLVCQGCLYDQRFVWQGISLLDHCAAVMEVVRKEALSCVSESVHHYKILLTFHLKTSPG